MTLGMMFFVFIAALVFAVIIVALNMGSVVTGKRTMGSVFVVHLLGGVVSVISGIGALVTGVMWLFQNFTA